VYIILKPDAVDYTKYTAPAGAAEIGELQNVTRGKVEIMTNFIHPFGLEQRLA